MKMERHIVAAMTVAALSGCATPSIRAAGDASALKIASVSVDTSKMAVVSEGRTLIRTKEQLADDVRGALTTELATVSDPKGTPVNVSVKLTRLVLATPISRAVAATSYVTSFVTATEVGSGRVVVPETEVSGNSENFRFIGWIGVVTTRSVENDYRGTLQGYAKTVREALFGPQS